MLKNVFPITVISFFLISCGKIPDAPEVWQCAFDGLPRSFYCINTKTKERIKVSSDNEAFVGAQCLRLEDYRKMQAWVKDLKKLAEERCK